jgi:phage-related minor tail protein
MPSAGYATLQIIPSVRGISDEIRRQLAGPAADAGDQAGQDAGGKFSEKWKAGLAAAGAAAGAILVASTVSAVEKERMADRLSAQLGLSGKGAKQAGKVAGDLYSKAVVDSFEDGAAAVRAVMGSGLIPEKATTKTIESITTKVSDLASTFDQDLGGAANAATQLIRTGLAKDAPAALDLLTAGLQSSADKAGDFLDTINEYGTQFRKAGLDGATAVGLLNQAIRAGARDSDVAADAIKEFSIRAVDGSKTSIDGFKALGLNADDMAAKFAKGGKAANGVLDLTLDKLRNVKDPVKQSQIAVQLFGTQAEDLGKALFAMDPSTAAEGLGKVGGAAKRVGDTIRGNTSTELKVLQRQLMGALGTVVNAVVLPALRGLIDAAQWLGEAISGLVRWFREFGIWLVPAAIAVAGLTAAVFAQQIAVAAVTAVFSVYRGVILAWTVVQKGATIAQAAFNAVLNANPIILVITAIVALAAAFYIAYQRSETFRNLVQSAWSGIQTAASFAWNSVLKPAFEGIKVALAAVGQAFVWLWNAVIKPVFGFISTAARVLLTILTIVVFGPIYLAVKVLGAIFSWLWTNAIAPAARAIGAVLQVMWSGVKVIFGAFMAAIRALGGVFRWLWTNAVKPVLSVIVAAATASWTGIKIVFGQLMSGLRLVGSVFKWLWNNGVKPAMNGIKSVVSTVYETGIKPVFERLKAATGRVKDAFDVARKGIKLAWDKVKSIAKTPVEFIIGTVYNGGIVKVWNAVASKFGAPTLDKIKGFATGGVLPGYTPGRDVHLAALSGGEAIMRPEWTRAVGSGYVHSMNAAARGGGVRGVQRALGLPGFADGGIFDWVKGTASKGVDLVKSGAAWLKDGIKASAIAGMNKLVKPLIEKISGSASLYKDMVTGIPKKILSAIFDFSGKADKKLTDAGFGGKGFQAALRWAKTQHGKKYQWGGNGDPSWDCSGFLSAIESVIRGQKPHRRWATGSFSGRTAPAGWKLNARSPFMIGITNAGVGHTAGTLNGVNVESRGGDGVLYGSRARGYRDRLFTDIYGFKGYAKGTRGATPGWAWVGELGPELVRFGGGEEVLNHRDSLKFATTMGTLPGYAKGTAAVRAAARKDLPGDLTKFTKSLTGSAADISKAAKELAKDLKSVGGAGTSLSASTLKASTKLQDLAKQRDSVDARLEAAKTAATDQKRVAADFFGLSNLTSATSVGDLISQMRNRQGTIKNFQSIVSALAKKGLDQSLIQQLVAQGPESALAGLLAEATGSQITQLNTLAKSGSSLSTSFGRSMADSMYDAGKNASKGFLTGLQSQEKELQAAMNKLAAGLVKAIQTKLKVKSPSRVTAWLGRMTGQGMRVGLDSTAAEVAASAARVSEAATPHLPNVSGTAAAGAGALRPGQKLRLSIRDREFDAFLEELADDRVAVGLTEARRSFTRR